MVNEICVIISSNFLKLGRDRVATRNALNFLRTERRFGISIKVPILVKANELID